MKMKYNVLAFIGKAGAGKDFLLQKFLTDYPGETNEIISCTTRPPRIGEQHGANYYFLTDDEFAAKVENGQMLEHTTFRGWHYGTSITELDSDRINVGVFNPAGIRSLLKNPEIKLRVVWVQAHDSTRLLRQMSREEKYDASEILRRFLADEEDFENIEFDYDIIWNDDRPCLDDV